VSFVLSGLGLDVDSQSSVVAFGLSIDLGTAPQPPTIVQLENTTIENWYAIDYRVRKRRPVTQIEWRRIRRLFRVWDRSRKAEAAKAEMLRRQEMRFNSKATGIPIPRPRRLPHPSTLEELVSSEA
jgi:hypothetical protein